jgi:hypothetical protein
MSKITLTPHASGTGTLNIAAPNTNSTRTLTLPDETGTILTSASSLASANLTGALPAIDGAALTGIVTGSLTLLGTLTTTSGTTQTLSGLTLTSYKQIYAVFKNVRSNTASAATLQLNSIGGDDISTNQNSGYYFNGFCTIDLASGVVVSLVNTTKMFVQTTITTASTSITFAFSNGSFYLGTITVYGVQ